MLFVANNKKIQKIVGLVGRGRGTATYKIILKIKTKNCMLKKIFGFGASALAAVGVMLGISPASAFFETPTSTPPTATEVLGLVMTTIINTTVSLAMTIFTSYWPYILVIGAIIGLIIWFKRLTGSSHK
jgi:hypothetical protein